jgi:hypothetical protein
MKTYDSVVWMSHDVDKSQVSCKNVYLLGSISYIILSKLQKSFSPSIIGNLRPFIWLLRRKKDRSLAKGVHFQAQSPGFNPHDKPYGISDGKNYFGAEFS